MKKHFMYLAAIATTSLLLVACGFKLQGSKHLALPLHKLYIESPHPYGDLAHYLASHLKASSVSLMPTKQQADTVLIIAQDTNTQELTSISSSQQTRQYQLKVVVTYSVAKPSGQTIIAPHTLEEARSITIQSNQILGSSNEANLYYQQMRRELAYAIMNQLSSTLATKQINAAFKKKATTPTKHRKVAP